MPRSRNSASQKGGGASQDDQPKQKSKNDICIPFLAGKCTFEKDCRKRHPSKGEVPRLLARYKKTRCRFGDDCYTEGCLFSHPREEKQRGGAFISPLNFPPLSNSCSIASGSSTDSIPKQNPVTDSAWNKNPPNASPGGAANRVSPSPSSHQLEDGSHQDADATQQDPTPHPPAPWGYPPPMMMNGHPQAPPMAIPPPQGYYTGPPLQAIPPVMLPPNIPPPPIDPNTGFPVDPAMAAYYYEQQQVFYQQQPQMGPPYPMMAGVGIPPMGNPVFNAEAKEFVPNMSS